MASPIREKMIAKVADLRASLQSTDPRKIAAQTGADFDADRSELKIPFYGEPYVVSYPDFVVRLATTGKECGLNRTSMFLYYFQTADGTPLSGKWIAFRDLPGGMFYHQAYQGYSGDRLAKAVDNRISVFERAARSLGGTRLEVGDAGFAFQALPRVMVAAVYYAGDDEFPGTANVLFDASANHYLPTDALAGVGSSLVDRLTGGDPRDDE